MPIIFGEWIAPSSIIAEIGLEEYLNSSPEDLASLAKKGKVNQMPTKVLEAREGFTFGCDPECFIKNTKTGKHVTAEGLIPGTKVEPHPVKHGAVQVDGMAAEFNIDPAKTFVEFNRNIAAVVSQLAKMLPPDHILDFMSAVTFDEDVFVNAPDKAKELGCSPDFNAWTQDVNPPPNYPDQPYLRTASGHLHVGWTEGEDVCGAQHLMNCNDLVKQFDWFLGGWSVKEDPDPIRRLLYGKAGSCRYKPYGVEYRVLSNFWVVSREKRLAIWNRMQLAIGSMVNNFMPDEAPSLYNKALQAGINTSVMDAALLRAFPYPLVSTEPTAIRPRATRKAFSINPY